MFTLQDLQISLQNDKASIMLKDEQDCFIHINGFSFNPEGDQTESELRKLALEQAKKTLIAAAEDL
ncbi:hypothetical protein [Brevundimonas naejangsanensis]|uniref:hypothetical protein n=1 Tax=Brevundimonas naejangsanensis TaxID=588932 RepID=UPI0034D65949